MLQERSTSGSAYGRSSQSSNDRLTKAGPGTPLGELLRRYWQPVAASDQVTNRPQMVRILDEDLVLFRDKEGRPGLLYPRCMHRGTSLYYGRVEDRGIRCCYHGWLFAVDGQCLEQPCEPGGGRGLGAVRQPSYPLQERYGLVFAYMGPPEKQPVLPRYDVLEDLAEDEFIETEATSFFVRFESGLDPVLPYNWLQHFENVVDPYHTYILHSHMSGIQLNEGFAIMPDGNWRRDGAAIVTEMNPTAPDGRKIRGSACCMVPNVSAIPAIDMKPESGVGLCFHLPIDDTHSRAFLVRKSRRRVYTAFPMYGGKTFSQRSANDEQDFPGDFEAQSGQGPVSLHSEEHLVSTDKGIVMLRRLLDEQMKLVEGGGDPALVSFDPADDLIRVPAGNFLV